MKKATIIRLFGSARTVAETLGLSTQAIHKWKDGKDIPKDRERELREKRPEMFARPSP